MLDSVKANYLSVMIAFVLLCVDCGVMQGQDAMVTFYSHGYFLTTGMPGTKHDIYIGRVFDGSQELFRFVDGFFAHNNRYITLRLASGPHTFGASNAKRPEARETLQLDLKAGERYFIRAQGESKGVPGIFEIQHGRLDLMPCPEARTELANAKPLKDKALSKEMRLRRDSLVITDTSTPSCH
jgi:hypothetical protein